MSTIKIAHWQNPEKILWEGEAGSLADAVATAVRGQANLSGANLGGVDLRGAKLGWAILREADLRGATLREANLARADLRRADLRGANLDRANLLRADLRGANLLGANMSKTGLGGAILRGAILPTGETWEAYLTETVPELLRAGGKALEAFGPSFECHSWEACPMSYAFDVHRLADVPARWRARAEEFVRLYDEGHIDWPLPQKQG